MNETERVSATVPVFVAAVFTAAVLLHGLDHLRRGIDAASDDVFWLGNLGVVLEVVVVVLVVQRHRVAPEAATAIGATLALGYLGVHFLPQHPWFSDSFTSARDVSPLSWAAASFEVAAATALAAFGVRAWRTFAAGGRPDSRPFASALRHPVACTMLVGNLLIVAAAFAQR